MKTLNFRLQKSLITLQLYFRCALECSGNGLDRLAD